MNPVEEAAHALNTARLPGFYLLERTHEHLVDAKAVGTVLVDDRIWIDHVAARFAHLLGDRGKPHAVLGMLRNVSVPANIARGEPTDVDGLFRARERMLARLPIVGDARVVAVERTQHLTARV